MFLDMSLSEFLHGTVRELASPSSLANDEIVEN